MEYQDSPIEWHTNPMYIEDMEHRSSLEYGISPIWINKDSNSSTNNNTGGAGGGTSGIHLQPRSTSRTSIYSTTSSSDQEGSSGVMLSTLEPVSSTRSTGQQQSLDEIEMISQVNNTATTNGTSGDRKTAESDHY